MIGIRFLTDAERPDGTFDDQLLVRPLARLGLVVQFIDWQSRVFMDSMHVVRSTWNYQRDCPAFLLAMAKVPRLHNAIEILEWNSDKRYLTELARRNVPTVPTRFATGPGLASILADCGWDHVVVKPAISAGGERTYRARGPAESAWVIAQLRADPSMFMVQPYLDRVTTLGEVSVMIAAGEVTHAVVKRPAAGGFLVHEEHGGLTQACPVDAELARLSLAAAACAPGMPTYARADWLFSPAGPQLVELELIEPALYLSHDARAPARFADAFARAAGAS